MNIVLTAKQVQALRTALDGRLLSLSFGAGVDSTAMLVALAVAGLRPDVITFADTGGEKPETLAHIGRISEVLMTWDWPLISVCRKVPETTTGYADLYGNCLHNETMPSLAFGRKSCSIKWKQVPQDQFLRGVTRGPNARAPHPIWPAAQQAGRRIVKLIGYDCGKADVRRAKQLPIAGEAFDYAYPLQIIGWSRPDCVHAITQYLGPEYVPIKSACFFCPASKHWELFWLAAHHPDLLDLALAMERCALTGKHSRFDAETLGASWETLVRRPARLPPTSATVGLGRSFAWNHWARVHDVVDVEFRVRRNEPDRVRFALLADLLQQQDDNALDARRRTVISIIPAAAPAQLSLF